MKSRGAQVETPELKLKQSKRPFSYTPGNTHGNHTHTYTHAHKYNASDMQLVTKSTNCLGPFLSIPFAPLHSPLSALYCAFPFFLVLQSFSSRNWGLDTKNDCFAGDARGMQRRRKRDNRQKEREQRRWQAVERRQREYNVHRFLGNHLI